MVGIHDHRVRQRVGGFSAVALLVTALVPTTGACAGDRPMALQSTVRAGGPRVVWDLGTKPLPTVPLPNDVATRLDDTSPTGRRVNVSLLAPTSLESDLRVKANHLDGFGVAMPIWLSFDRTPDLAAIRARHLDQEWRDDVLFLVNVDRDSPGFGERIPLSLADGVFPVALEDPGNYFANDPRSTSMNVMFETVQEDLDCDGVLDVGEDTDADGVLDHPNTLDMEWFEDRDCDGTLDPGEDFDCDGILDLDVTLVEGLHEDANCNGLLDVGEDLDCDGELDVDTELIEPDPGDLDADFVLDGGEVWDCDDTLEPALQRRQARRDRRITDHLPTFYEFETDTLIARPIVPMREQTTYAVLLTRRIVDDEGRPLESPFDGIAHASQRDAIAPLPEVLGALELALDDVAFAWTFTTGSATFELERLRQGLYGAGPFARLADEFPVTDLVVERLHDGNDIESPYVVQAADLEIPLTLLAEQGVLGAAPDISAMGHFVAGTFSSPNFLVDTDGIATADYPADDDESFDIDPLTGDAIYASADVTFWCVIPKVVPGEREPPFPVQIYGHGYTLNRTEGFAAMGHLARFGFATCALDAYGHGVAVSESDTLDLGNGPVPVSEAAYDLAHDLFGLGGLAGAILKGRARDLNNDGFEDSGGDFWTADTFHTRDVVRQSIVDHMQFIRALRAFGSVDNPIDVNGDGEADLLGDFDGDGVVDFGGPDVTYAAWGMSLGGVLSSVLAGAEPALDAAAPVAGGAGLIDIGVRSIQPGVPEAVFLPLLGPMVTFDPVDDTTTAVAFVLNDVNATRERVFHHSTLISAGDRVHLYNPANGEHREIVVPADRAFRLAVAADALSATEKRPLLTDALSTVVDHSSPEPGGAPAVLVPEALGDPLVITVYDGMTGVLEETIDRVTVGVTWQGAHHPAGSRLVALASGFGFERGTPDLRRFLGIAAMILQAADPVAYAPRYWKDPLDVSDYDPGAVPGVNVLVIPTGGDMNVPVNAGIMTAVAAGTVGATEIDPRYGKTQLQLLADTYTFESIERLGRHPMAVDIDADGDCEYEATVTRFGVYDIDDLDQGRSEYHAPSPDEPLRAIVRSADGSSPAGTEHCTGPDADSCGVVWEAADGLNAMRIPYLDYRGQHGFGELGWKCRPFDMDRYMANLVGAWFSSAGTALPDHTCLDNDSCPFVDWMAASP